MEILLADKQGITQAGLMYLCTQAGYPFKVTEDKAEVIEGLKATPTATVILDYTLFDINDADELLILGQRFPLSSWILFSEDLSIDFVKIVTISSACSSRSRRCQRYARRYNWWPRDSASSAGAPPRCC